MSNFLTTMIHYYWREGNKIVVQNMVGGYQGQEHRHSLEDFEEWRKQINPDHLVNINEDE